MKKKHKPHNYGIDVYSGKVVDMMEKGVIESLKTKTTAIKTATEAAVMILRIDDIIHAGRTNEPANVPKKRPLY